MRSEGQQLKFILWKTCFIFHFFLNLSLLLLHHCYSQTLMEDEPEKYQTHFSEYVKRGIDADGLEALYKKVHAAIRADPTAKQSEKEAPKTHKR